MKTPPRHGRFDGIKLVPFGILLLLAGLAKALHGFGSGFGRALTLDDGLTIMLLALLLAVFLVGAAVLITRLRK